MGLPFHTFMLYWVIFGLTAAAVDTVHAWYILSGRAGKQIQAEVGTSAERLGGYRNYMFLCTCLSVLAPPGALTADLYLYLRARKLRGNPPDPFA